LIAVQLRWSLRLVLNDIKLEFVDDVLAETTPANKQVVQKVLDGFLETLEEEDVSKFDKLLTAIGQAIEYTGSSLED